MSIRLTPLVRSFAILAVLAITAGACGSSEVTTSAECFEDPGLEAIAAPDGDLSGSTLTLATHDSFFLSEGTLDAFTDDTGITVEQIAVGDAGQLVSQSILTAENPTADVLFGIDNTFLCRGLEASIFTPYASPALASVDDALELDPHNRVTPISYGDVCVNYWTEALPGDAPTSLDDLIDPANVGQFVTENPETSSPGFAFLLATIAEYGDPGWEDFWRSLVENDVSVTAGWNDAYYGEFAAGGGPRSIVTSYASSPSAEFLFADPPVEAPPTGVLSDSCFRQIEFAGILTGTAQPAAAAALIDFMLSTTYQEDVPLNMFVYPANTNAALPTAFVEFGPLVDDALVLDPAVIEANRDDWTERWNEIVAG
ncbi:MAG: thiamine ABC transporter substrate-binding protein [Acidimicrobiales bacterium]